MIQIDPLDDKRHIWYTLVMNEPDYIMTTREAAKYMGVSKVTLSRHINEKVNPIPTIRLSLRLVRIRKSTLDEWINKMTRR